MAAANSSVSKQLGLHLHVEKCDRCWAMEIQRGQLMLYVVVNARHMRRYIDGGARVGLCRANSMHT